MAQDLNSQRIVMRALLNDPAAVVSVMTRIGLLPAHFSEDLYRRIYTIAQQEALRSSELTRTELAAACEQSGKFSPSELHSLQRILSSPKAEPLGDPLKAATNLVKADAARAAAGIIASWQREFEASPVKAAQSLGPLAASLINLSEGSIIESGYPGDIVERANVTGAIYAISTGIPALDYSLRIDDHLPGGFREGEMMVIGMPSGHGKSSTAAFFACEMVRRGLSCIVFELEMQPEAFLFRCISNLARLPLRKAMVEEYCTAEELAARKQAINVLQEYLRVYHSPQEISDIVVWMKAGASSLPSKVALVIIDHIGYITGKEAQRLDRWAALESMSIGVSREIAQRYSTSCVVFSQLPGELENEFRRTNTISGMLRFRGSAGIYHAADVAIVAGRHNGLDKDGFPNPALANLSAWTVRKVRLTGRESQFVLRYEPDFFTYGPEVSRGGLDAQFV